MRGREVTLIRGRLRIKAWRLPWTGAIRSIFGTHHEARYVQQGFSVWDPAKNRGGVWHRRASA